MPELSDMEAPPVAATDTDWRRGPDLGASFGELITSGDWLVASARAQGRSRLSDCSPMAKVELAAPPAGALADRLQVAPGRAEWFDDGLTVLGLTPGAWLLISPDDAGKISDRLAAMTEDWTTFTDVTHGRFLFRLTSPHAVTILSRVSSLDLDERRFDLGSVTTGSVAGARTTVVRDDLEVPDSTDDPDGTDEMVSSFLLIGNRSAARHVADTLLSAGADMGLEPEGPTA